MPGIPLVTRETSSHSRSTDQMCHDDSHVHLSAEEEIAAEESLSIYCKPVELYNILQRRAIQNPSFLQRCLHYKIQAKHKMRIQMTVSLSGTVKEGVQAPCLFPLYVSLARLVSDPATLEYSAVYCFRQACILTSFTGIEGSSQAQATFLLPEINKLAMEVKSSSLAIIFISFAGTQNSLCGVDSTRDPTADPGGYCLWGNIPLECLCMSWEKSPNLSLGHKAEGTFSIEMWSRFFKLNYLNEDNCISIQSSSNSLTMNILQQVQVTISAEVVGAKEKSLYNLYTHSNISSSSLSHIIRLRAGNVLFNYRYYNNKLQRTEVTEDFSCPFCLVKCASFKGLRYHLPASHDLFNFEFWVTEEHQAVNVSVKTDILRSEIVADGIDPKQQTFFFCSKQRRRRRANLVQNARHVHPLGSESNLPAVVHKLLDKAHGGKDSLNACIGAADCAPLVPSGFIGAGSTSAAGQSLSDVERVRSVPGSNLAPPAMLPFAKTRKLSIERPDQRNRTQLQKRMFFHSHRAQVLLLVLASVVLLSMLKLETDSQTCGQRIISASMFGTTIEPLSLLSDYLIFIIYFETPKTACISLKPMAIEQVMSDRDSEDEVDDDVADFEDRRMLDDFVDVTRDEKQMMHLWNSFVRKQRVLADGHIPWACESFSKLHGPDLIKAPSLIRYLSLLS
ncbi:hypothetical protein SLEP1_g28005 [Rubroshorea leprosula]|uniref:Polycomb protein VEFS-Box domain-containing protein n=1 Tax=Rubroshorea leprosula TaxID=152421 RepID=A0AAV5JYQ0_9ROSI|nr:hypothetical protein SLEP1_g28005 [Rubroshorea leprosula]